MLQKCHMALFIKTFIHNWTPTHHIHISTEPITALDVQIPPSSRTADHSSFLQSLVYSATETILYCVVTQTLYKWSVMLVLLTIMIVSWLFCLHVQQCGNTTSMVYHKHFIIANKIIGTVEFVNVETWKNLI
jgi:hypothetical protein